MNNVVFPEITPPAPQEGDLQVWWIPNPPRAPFVRNVPDLETGVLLIDTLASYDLYLDEAVIWGNAGGIQVFRDGDWEEVDEDDYSELVDALEERQEAGIHAGYEG